MKELIYLSHRIPYPPNKGDKIRSWHFLRRLAERWTVHLGTFVDDPDDWQYTDHLAGFCEETKFLRLRPLTARLRAMSGLLTGSSLTMPYYRNAELGAWVSGLVERRNIDCVLAFSSSMAQYLPDAPVRKVVDFCDVDSDKWRQYSEKFGGLKRWVYAREADRLATEELRMAQRSDASVLISDDEAALFRSLGAGGVDNVSVVANGVDVEFFDPALEYPDPYAAGAMPLVFVGAMDYWPNIDAVTWFATEILPAVRRALPDVRFFIVGSNPDPQVTRLAQVPGITVTGRVADVRPWLQHAAAVVAPLRVARGVQNKVLEAMAMGRPILASPAAMEGIVVDEQAGIRICRKPDEWARHLLEIAENAGGGFDTRALRAHVTRHFSWDASAAALAALVAGPGAAPAVNDVGGGGVRCG